MKRRIPSGLAALLRVLPVAAYPVVFLYAHNAAELRLNALWPPLFMALVLAALVFVALRLIGARPAVAGLLAQGAILLGAYYRLCETLVRSRCAYIRYWHLAPSIGLLIVLLGARARRLGEPGQRKLERFSAGAALVFGALVGLNALAIIPSVHARHVAAAVAPDRRQALEFAGTGAPVETNRPDVYYVILDEYSGFDAVRRQYGYDNSDFLTFLRDRGFSVSLTSRNATAATNIEVTNIMEMGPSVSDATPDAERYARYRRGALLAFFRGLGYRTVVVNTVWQDYVVGDVTYRGGNWMGQTDGNGESLVRLLLRQSILHPLELSTLSDAQLIRSAFDFVAAAGEGKAPVFVFSHMRCPHEPFLFDAEGGLVPSAHHHNWADKRYYLGHYQYATRRIRETLAAILEREPDSVIILQSDHGARAHERITGRAMQPFTQEDQTSILNAVYFRGKPFEIEGLSGLETGLRVYAALLGGNGTAKENSHE